MPWIKRTIRSGELLEVEHYYATRNGRRIPRGGNREESTLEQELANQRAAEKRLKRLIAANYGRGMGGASYTFTSPEDITEAEAMKRERQLLERIKRRRAKLGLEPLKYIAVTEKQSRWHHHILMQDDLPMEDLRELWAGKVSIYPIAHDVESYGEAARYLMMGHKARRNSGSQENVKQQRRKWQHRYHASRNLNQPVETKVETARPPRVGVPKVPKGYRLLADWAIGTDALGNVYTYFSAVSETENVAGTRRRAGKVRRE